MGSRWKVGNGKKVLFWEDWWCKNCPLKIYFFSLYRICNQQNCFVRDIARNGTDGLTFRRAFSAMELESWKDLCEMINNIQVNNEDDTLQWDLDGKKSYTSSSMYSLLSFGGVKDVKMNLMWKAPIPLKIKHFIWLVARGGIQAAAVLKSKNWEGGAFCWTIWLTRNEMIFRAKTVNSPCLLIYRVVSLLTQWCALAKEEEEKKM
uniref:Reverse transcriptase zinc-binding domain-containing protein n=1 Tax=Oryza brachyantha TaxID=4533 RepID=J3MHG3_ORYBR